VRARALRRSAKTRSGAKSGEVGINRLLARLRHIYSWAIDEGYVDETPVRRAGKTVVRLETRAETARTRRLEPGEEVRLLAAAGPHLRALIVAALSTGCRAGELLTITWGQIRRDEQGKPRWLLLPAHKTKTNESRTIPVGPRLRAELAMRRHGPDGKELSDTAYIFGDEIGDQVAAIKTAWRATCRRAGIRDLHFHDLRREFGSQLLESRRERARRPRFSWACEYHDDEPLPQEHAASPGKGPREHGKWTDSHIARTNGRKKRRRRRRIVGRSRD
jgi:integrase